MALVEATGAVLTSVIPCEFSTLPSIFSVSEPQLFPYYGHGFFTTQISLAMGSLWVSSPSGVPLDVGWDVI